MDLTVFLLKYWLLSLKEKTINGSNLASVKLGVFQGSVFVSLLLLINIYDLNQALKFCKVHHFADGTKLFQFSESVNRPNKYDNLDSKNLTYLCQQNLTECERKTELVIFKHQRKKSDNSIKIKLGRKRIYPSKSVKNFGIKIDENLNWKQNIYDLAMKLYRSSALLCTIRNYVNKHILGTVYIAIFDTHINYSNLI